MTYPYGAFAMLCFALTYLYAMLVVPPLLARINARSNTRFLSPFVFHILYSFISPSLPYLPISIPTGATPAFFHASLYLIRFIASTIPELSLHDDLAHTFGYN